jgi:hypothetical protein
MADCLLPLALLDLPVLLTFCNLVELELPRVVIFCQRKNTVLLENLNFFR